MLKKNVPAPTFGISSSLSAPLSLGKKAMPSFLTGLELNSKELLKLLHSAVELKRQKQQKIPHAYLAGKQMALLFEKPSLRTRFSFTAAMNDLGGHVIEAISDHQKNETPEDLGKVLGSYVDVIVYRCHAHEKLERIQKVCKIPVVNALSDDHHPCQALADALTLWEAWGAFEGKKLAYVGDGNNVLNSLLYVLPALGVSVSCASPAGYQVTDEVKFKAKARCKYGATVEFFEDPALAVQGADAIYTDVWTSMGFEEESQKREVAFKGYQINAGLYAVAAPGAAIMHCMPIERGKEITEEMVIHPSSVIYQQAENRLHVQKALLLNFLMDSKIAHAAN